MIDVFEQYFYFLSKYSYIFSTMGVLMGCGVCCTCLSIWAIIQLSLMGYFYHVETAILIEDVQAQKEDYNTFDEYIKATRNNYAEAAINCWIAAAAYAVTLFISCICIMSAKKSAAKRRRLEEDDEYICTPKPTKFEKEMAKRRAKAAKLAHKKSPPKKTPIVSKTLIADKKEFHHEPKSPKPDKEKEHDKEHEMKEKKEKKK